MSSRFGSIRRRAREAAEAAREGNLLTAASATVAVAATATSAAVSATSAVAAYAAGTEDWVNGRADAGTDDADKFMMAIEEEMQEEMALARLREAELRHAMGKLPKQPAAAPSSATEPGSKAPATPLSADDAVRRKQALLRSRIAQLEKQAQTTASTPESTMSLSDLPPGTLAQGSGAGSRAGSSVAGSDAPNDAVRRRKRHTQRQPEAAVAPAPDSVAPTFYHRSGSGPSSAAPCTPSLRFSVPPSALTPCPRCAAHLTAGAAQDGRDQTADPAARE